jgi:HTH-type transcriptional regulator/antitoxin HigA
MFALNPSQALQNEDEYKAALAEIRPYFEGEPNEGSDEAARFDMLFMLIENYEADHYPAAAA